MYVHLGLQCRRPWFNSWVRKFPWRRDRLPTPVFMDFPGGSDSKESACNAGDLGLIPGLGRYPLEKGNEYPLQCSGLEKSMDRGTWQATVHGFAKSQTWLSNFHFHFPARLRRDVLISSFLQPFTGGPTQDVLNKGIFFICELKQGYFNLTIRHGKAAFWEACIMYTLS